MKRSFSLFSAPNPASATPQLHAVAPTGPPPKSRSSSQRRGNKRLRGSSSKGVQTTLRPFLRVNTPSDDTPSGAPSSAMTKGPATALGQLRLYNRTPSTDLPSFGQQVPARHGDLPGRTGSPGAHLEGEDELPGGAHEEHQAGDDAWEEDDDFRIVSSQTYHRPATQPELTQEDTNSSWQDAWMPSGQLSRGQHRSSAAAGRQQHDPQQQRQQQRQGPQRRQQQDSQPTEAHHDTVAEDTLSNLTQPMAPADTASGGAADEPDSHAPRLTPSQLLPAGPMQMTAQGAAGQEATGSRAGGGAQPSTSDGGAGHLAVTPELAPVLVSLPSHMTEAGAGPAGADEVGKQQAVAPLFKKASERKLLVLVRHGESEYNAAIRTSRSVADPNIFDARLTPRGMQQCAELRGELLKLVLKHRAEFGDPLWVVSPLTRAIQTFLHSCPFPERLPTAPALPFHAPGAGPVLPALPPPGGAAATGSGAGSGGLAMPAGPSRLASSSRPQQQQQQGALRASSAAPAAATAVAAPAAAALQVPAAAAAAAEAPLNVAVLPCIAELMATPGDVGRPPAMLVQEFPQLSAQLSELPEVWWHHTAQAASCAVSRRWVGSESADCGEKRVQALASWLRKRPERLVVLVGHSMFWQKFLGKMANKQPLKNCGFLTLTW